MEKAKCFKQSEVFPVIAKAIRTVHETTREFVTHDRLVEALMDDPVIRITLDAAPKRGYLLSGRALVSNMVAWFSRRITAKTSKYQHDFERVKLAERETDRLVGSLHPYNISNWLTKYIKLVYYPYHNGI